MKLLANLREIISVSFHGSVIASAIGMSRDLVLLKEILDLFLKTYKKSAKENLEVRTAGFIVQIEEAIERQKQSDAH